MRRSLSSWLTVLCTFVFLLPATALAAGSARFKSTDLQEVSGQWHVYITIELPKPPPIPHVPMKFVLTKQVVFERALVDNSREPVINRQVVQNPMPTFESLDVDFANPQGKIFKGTRFDFSLTRPKYEAGEYKVQIRTADGLDIGAAQTLTLRGDNEVQDRRSVTFEAKKSGTEKIGQGGGNVTKGVDPNWQPPSQEVTPAGSSAAFIPASAHEKIEEEEIKERPKGCGCDVIDQRSTTAFAGFGVLALLAGFVLRRTRS